MPVDTENTKVPHDVTTLLRTLLTRVLDRLFDTHDTRTAGMLKEKLKICTRLETVDENLKRFLGDVSKPGPGVERLRAIMKEFDMERGPRSKVQKQTSEVEQQPNAAHMVIFMAPIILVVMDKETADMHGLRICEMGMIFDIDCDTFKGMIQRLKTAKLSDHQLLLGILDSNEETRKPFPTQLLPDIQRLWTARRIEG
ncbi:uncharacterized protein K489DRAFT_139596 [Dissoconium aciculare CBS 342.82]|uniref:Uncharacterized protein n=1 Tax=Dissoconium aciculare CBS 342.82 TaxID=1314786 RepID=A0A6J3LPE3_9PEZI|nr:uncharacterized protein K489DRAFT_139596 [Dissoconium aciculare CBS 342.82]KAF1817821.1 hypothetical protein K489DRAFT_139596 [Dissoconium aciculare CBS 342.82]